VSIFSRVANFITKARPSTLEEKANPQYAGMTLIDGMQQPRSMPRNYRSYAREGYGVSDTLYKCIQYIITNGAAIPPVLFTDKSQINKPNGERIESHVMLDKLEQPNVEQDGVSYREAVLGYYLIAGNSFQFANRVAKAGPPDELWTLPPDRMRPIPDEQRGIIGYEYEDWPAEKNPIPPQLICHMRTWNPNDPFFGMSPIEVAAIIIDQQTALRKWNLALLQNFAKPPGAWTTTALLSPNERSKLEARINERMTGYRNAGKIPLLDGALKFEPSAVAPSELDWLASDMHIAGRIANVFFLAPQIIGDNGAATYDNMDIATMTSYTEGIFPVLDKFYAGLNRWLVPMYSDLAGKGKSGPYLYYDKQSVEVIQKMIQAQKDAQAKRGNTAYTQGVAMLDEARELQGLPPLPNGTGRVFRIGAVLIPADKLMDYAEQSLTEPAAPPLPIPEPLSSATPLQGDGEQNTVPDGGKSENKAKEPQQPTTDWVPENFEEIFQAYQQEGVTHLTWRVDGNPCEECLKNKDVTVKLGERFPSGALFPPQHPNCECKAVVTKDEKRVRREEYKRFMDEVLV
jgi:HK97 family phage portal protein